ncbi:trihelix transcription factor ASIL2-like [Chenopodium quinoa]|uniref:trihelix transcription factor ASIL2-like n=1 Tax=Chenopodium quinoa TaxID=63459 RepID=UPI000B780D69|nr:trihelix transcription factor ASIL2-like [Chenopodium quinoa]
MAAPKQSGGRDDCWSEESTAVLIEAWGERYLRSNRGNLRQNDWNEVADAVNSAGITRRKTDIQCKNRIDTIKKKYKVEKVKSPPSTWRFFERLDFLIGNVTSSAAVKVSVAENSSPNPNPNHNHNRSPNLKSSLNSSESTQSDEDGEAVEMVEERERETAVKELARAVVKFGEVYERIENWKQEKFMELEKQKLELAKELELQRMNMFVDAQIQLERLKRSNKSSASTGKIL